MSSFLLLNKYVAVPILSEWCTLKDIVYLDIALACNVKLHQSLLSWFQEFSEFFSKNIFTCKRSGLTSQLYSWSKKRGLDCSELECSLTELMVTRMLESGVKDLCHFSSVKHLYLTQFTEYCKDTVSSMLILLKNVETVRLYQSPRVPLFTYDLPFQNLISCNVGCGAEGSKFVDVHIDALCRNCTQLTELNISATTYSIQNLSRQSVLCIIIHARRLQHFTLTEIKMSKVLHKCFMLHCKAPLLTLCGVDLYGISYVGKNLQKLESKSVDTINIAESCPNVTHLRLNSISVVDDYFYDTMDGLRNLTFINLLQVENELVLIKIATTCVKLQTLILPEVNIQNNEAIDALAANLTELTTLALPEWFLRNDELIKIVQNNKQLTYLNLRNNTMLSDTSIIELAKNCRKLKKLNIFRSSVSNEGLIALSTFCKRLEDLNVSYCYNISDDGVLYLLNGLPLTSLIVTESMLSVSVVSIIRKMNYKK